MTKLICDKCGCESGEWDTYRVWSDSQSKEVLLCRSCDDKYQTAMLEADRKFFESEDN